MRERVDAGFRQRDGVVVVEDVRRGLEPVLVRFVDGRTRQRDRKTRRRAAGLSTQILMMSTFLAACSCTARRICSSVVTA